MKDAVDVELETHGVDSKVNRIAIIRKHTAEAYKNESEEIKNEIRAMQEQEQEKKEAMMKVDQCIVNGSDGQGPETYLLYDVVNLIEIYANFFYFRAQSSLPTVIKNFCEAMSARTGWSFSVLAGGPDPAANGSIRTIGIHVGQNAYGHSFGRAAPNFPETFMKPYSTFLHSVYRELTYSNTIHFY